jgi:hypothetical protein
MGLLSWAPSVDRLAVNPGLKYRPVTLSGCRVTVRPRVTERLKPQCHIIAAIERGAGEFPGIVPPATSYARLTSRGRRAARQRGFEHHPTRRALRGHSVHLALNFGNNAEET